jgi:hypothetical protein
MGRRHIKKRSVDAAKVPETGTAKSRITKRSLDAPKAPEIRHETPKLAHTRVDELELASAREKILEQKYEIEELKAALSGSYVERLKAERERRENEKLNAELKIATLKNGKLIHLSRSQREQADQLRQVIEAIAAWLEKGVFPLRSPELIDGDDDLGLVATDDRAGYNPEMIQIRKLVDWIFSER